MKSVKFKIMGLIAIVAAGALIALGCALLAMSRIDAMNDRSSGQNHIALAAERLNVAVNQVIADSYLVYTARNPHFANIAATTVEAGLTRVEERRKDLAGRVRLSAREINTGADDLSKRTEEQASSLEESAATTEELAASVKASAQGARQAAAIAGEAVAAMARIEEATKKISAIIRVIDDIAFQTNLLALNAAVEAARAGDAGKGFAVVASEVRTLAQRSSEAAKDISGLISSSNIEVEAGVKLVRRAGDALGRIVSASEKVTGTIRDISAATGEQANGIDEMSQTVAHLDEMTQANAALAEQSAASAGALSGKIGELNALVSAFRTGEGGPATAPARPYQAPANDSEPERLRKLAEAAFAQSQAAPRRERPAAPPAPIPARKVANARAGDAGWEEF